MDDSFEIYCSYCGNIAVLIRTVGKGSRVRKEYLCNDCIEKDMNGELNQKNVLVDNI